MGVKMSKPPKAPPKKRLRSIADGLWQQAVIKFWGDKCVCGSLAYCGHHYYYKGSYGHLRYEIQNGVPICVRCHNNVHRTGDPKKVEDRIITKRGQRWVEDLRKLANQTPASYMTVGWYKKNIERLKAYLES